MKTAISQLMHSDFQKRKMKNSSYSLRSYARDLGIHAALALRYMRNERKPSVPTLKKILDRVEADESLKLLILNAAIRGVEFKIPKDDEYVEVNLEQRKKLNDWIYSALMELLRSKKRKITAFEASKILKLPVKEVEKRIEVLLQAGVLQKTQSGFRMKAMRQSSVSLGKAVSKIHEGYLSKAIDALSAESNADITGTTVLISSKRLEEAKLRIRDFRRSLSGFLAVKDDEKEERLYRIQIAMFSLE